MWNLHSLTNCIWHYKLILWLAGVFGFLPMTLLMNKFAQPCNNATTFNWNENIGCCIIVTYTTLWSRMKTINLQFQNFKLEQTFTILSCVSTDWKLPVHWSSVLQPLGSSIYCTTATNWLEIPNNATHYAIYYQRAISYIVTETQQNKDGEVRGVSLRSNVDFWHCLIAKWIKTPQVLDKEKVAWSNLWLSCLDPGVEHSRYQSLLRNLKCF